MDPTIKIASISLREYWMGRDGEFPPTPEIERAAGALLGRVNRLLVRLQWPSPALVSSGYRPGRFNRAAGGAPHSGHLVGRAIDVADGDGRLKMAILASGADALLTEMGLWMESPARTPGWVHLDTIDRGKTRIFLP